MRFMVVFDIPFFGWKKMLVGCCLLFKVCSCSQVRFWVLPWHLYKEGFGFFALKDSEDWIVYIICWYDYVSRYIDIYVLFLYIRNTYSLQKIGTSILRCLSSYILKLYKTVSEALATQPVPYLQKKPRNRCTWGKIFRNIISLQDLIFLFQAYFDR